MNKRQVLEGMLCARRRWWAYHEPDAPELAPDEVADSHLDFVFDYCSYCRGSVGLPSAADMARLASLRPLLPPEWAARMRQ